MTSIPPAHPLDGSADGRNFSRVCPLIVLHEEGQGRAVRSEFRLGDAAVELGGQNARFAAFDRHDGQPILVVGIVLRLESPGEGQRSSVGAPDQPLPVRRADRRHLARLGSGPGLDDEDVAHPGPVRILPVAPDKGDPRSVWGPGRITLVMICFRGQGGQRFRPDVEQVETIPVGGREIPHPVPLEGIPVDDDRLRRLGFRIRRLVRDFFSFLHDQHEPLPVRRPFIGAELALDVRQGAGLAAAPVEQPDLGLAVGRTGGEKGQVFPVRAPAWGGVPLRPRGHRDVVPALPVDHPDGASRFVGLAVHPGNGVSDPSPVRRHLRIGNLQSAQDIVDRKRPLGRSLGEGEGQAKPKDQGDGSGRKNGFSGHSHQCTFLRLFRAGGQRPPAISLRFAQ